MPLLRGIAKRAAEQKNASLVRLLLEHGAYPPENICASGYKYNHTRTTPLKRAVQSRSLDDVSQLLLEGTDDVNAHPRFCVRRLHSFRYICRDCDTPLMAAVRREDIAMMRLLIENGASVSEGIPGDYGSGFLGCTCSRKTALLVAVYTENDEVIKELVTSGADVNQSLGPIGTVLHVCYDQAPIVQLLVQLGANPDASCQDAGCTALVLLLLRSDNDECGFSSSAHKSLRCMLRVTRELDNTLHVLLMRNNWYSAALSNDIVASFLQHGARIRYCTMYLTGSSELASYWASELREESKLHSERFIDLLRAADTDFDGARQQIASVDKDEWATLNLDVLDQKLSQPLTLQTSCVISVRRQLRSVSVCGMWTRIEKLSIPSIIKGRLKLTICD